MTKEMIKAIRMVNGFNPDLRIKLTTINKSALWDWLDKNRFGIFGLDIGCSRPRYDSDDWNKYERMLWSAVNQIISGKGD